MIKQSSRMEARLEEPIRSGDLEFFILMDHCAINFSKRYN